jgi:proline iminopeptidase
MRRAIVLALLGGGLQQACGTGGGARADSPAREGRLAVAPGATLHYRVVGAGPDTVIVLPGGPGLHDRYLMPVFDPLDAHHVFIYYDQRGRGLSEASDDSTQLTAARDVEDLDSLRRSFGISRVSLIGHHWGAVLAALYAKRFPEHVQRLLLVSPSFPHASYLFWAATLRSQDRAAKDYLAALGAGADTTDPHAFCTRYWGFLFSPTPVVERELVHDLSADMCAAPANALRRSWLVNRLVPSSLHGLNLKDTLSAVSAPLLVIRGAADTASKASAQAWIDWAPQARELVLPGPGLFPWRGSEGRFRRAADEFLDGTWPDGSSK